MRVCVCVLSPQQKKGSGVTGPYLVGPCVGHWFVVRGLVHQQGGLGGVLHVVGVRHRQAVGVEERVDLLMSGGVLLQAYAGRSHPDPPGSP